MKHEKTRHYPYRENEADRGSAEYTAFTYAVVRVYAYEYLCYTYSKVAWAPRVRCRSEAIDSAFESAARKQRISRKVRLTDVTVYETVRRLCYSKLSVNIQSVDAAVAVRRDSRLFGRFKSCSARLRKFRLKQVDETL